MPPLWRSSPIVPLQGPWEAVQFQSPPLRPILLPDRPLPLVRPPGLGSRMPSPVCPITLASALHGCNNNLVSYLVHGFTFGFQIGCVGVPPPPTSVIRNRQSADTFSTVIDRKLTKELVLGRILGPNDVMPNYPNYRISPMGVVPKKTLREFRMIHHLSFPEGYSVILSRRKCHQCSMPLFRMPFLLFNVPLSLFIWLKSMLNLRFVLCLSHQLTALCWDFSGSGSSIWMQFSQWAALVFVPFFNVSARL